jgi:hypothetical protein
MLMGGVAAGCDVVKTYFVDIRLAYAILIRDGGERE